MAVPDLYVFTLKFHSNFSLYKKDKNMKKKKSKEKEKKKNTFILWDFSVRTLWYFQKKFKDIFWPRKSEKMGLKSCS